MMWVIHVHSTIHPFRSYSIRETLVCKCDLTSLKFIWHIIVDHTESANTYGILSMCVTADFQLTLSLSKVLLHCLSHWMCCYLKTESLPFLSNSASVVKLLETSLFQSQLWPTSSFRMPQVRSSQTYFQMLPRLLQLVSWCFSFRGWKTWNVFVQFSGDFAATRFSSNFTALTEVTTAVYSFEFRVTNDLEVEEEEGFIVYFDFDESEISADDYSRLDTGIGALLISISDDDTCK